MESAFFYGQDWDSIRVDIQVDSVKKYIKKPFYIIFKESVDRYSKIIMPSCYILYITLS